MKTLPFNPIFDIDVKINEKDYTLGTKVILKTIKGWQFTNEDARFKLWGNNQLTICILQNTRIIL